MSALFSSFIIEPVVRQARRFSSQGSTTLPRADPRLSHANRDALPEDARAAAQCGTGLVIVEDLVIVDELAPAVQDSIQREGDVAAVASLREVPESLDPVTQHQDPGTALRLDGAVDSVESTPAQTPDDVPTLDESLLQPPPTFLQPTPTREIQQEDTVMAPSQSLHPRQNGRTSYARDIPRPQMSLREHSPSQHASSLPADDGMRQLRAKIHQIRGSRTSQEEKARRMHELMTEEWQAAQTAMRPQSPASMVSHEGRGGFMPSSPMSAVTLPTSPESVATLSNAARIDPANPFNVQPEDMQPSYRPLPPPDSSEDTANDSLPEPVLGCKHYKRNVKSNATTVGNGIPAGIATMHRHPLTT